jgi:hypothetical protein
MISELILLALLFTKHLIVDFPLQRPYQWKNKGTYGHPGGILHATLHSVGTFVCLCWIIPLPLCLVLGMIDGLVHYHIDWAKMNINRAQGWGATTHEQFWVLLGVDQYLHAMTYIGIIFAIDLIYGI